jgi:hypothetical protein
MHRALLAYGRHGANVFVALGVAVVFYVGADALLHARHGQRAGQGLGKQLFGVSVVSAYKRRG